MEHTTGILDLAARAACRALASWQELTTPATPTGPRTPADEPAHTEPERHAA
ncbi:MAG: hypothetical protein RL531_1937 [Actinomycetota bacterium]|jgi:hypothetical protein